MYKASLLLGLALSSSPAMAVTISTSIDPILLASKLQAGSEVKNIVGNGQIGTFDNLVIRGANNSQLVLDTGLVLSTGYLNGLPTSNTMSSYGTDIGSNGDPLINVFPVVGNNNRGGLLSSDAAVIRFRFTAPSNVNGVIARFVYASEEYPEFSGTQYADGFAFARSELDANGNKQDINYAILPNGKPVSLLDQGSNIHFMANGNPANPNVPGVADLEFDGITRILTVRAPVTPGAVEDFSLIIADTGDGVYDSAVFMSALSFFNDPTVNFKIGTVAIEDNPAFQPFASAVPLPAAVWLFLTGLIGILASHRRKNVANSKA